MVKFEVHNQTFFFALESVKARIQRTALSFFFGLESVKARVQRRASIERTCMDLSSWHASSKLLPVTTYKHCPDILDDPNAARGASSWKVVLTTTKARKCNLVALIASLLRSYRLQVCKTPYVLLGGSGSRHFWQVLFSNSVVVLPLRRRRLYSPHAHDAKIPGACYTIIYSSLP